MTWGVWGKSLSSKDMLSLMHHCLERGITTFDHADIYGGYTTEAEFGKVLTESNVKREDIRIITKCGIQYVCEARPNRIKHYDYSKDHIIWSAEESLRNLKTEYLDLFLLHRPSPLMEPEEIAEAITSLKTSGKIKAFGVSNFIPSQIGLLQKHVPVAVNQIEFSLTAHDAMHNGSLDHMMLQDITPMAWSPLGKVFKERDTQTDRIRTLLLGLVSKYEVSVDQLLLAWVLRHPSGIYPVIGTTSPHRIAQATEALLIDLELQDWFAMLVASQGHKVP